MSFLRATFVLDLLYVPIKYYLIIPNSMGVIACIIFRVMGDNYITKKNESSLSCTRHPFWTWSMPLFNIIRIFQTTKKSRSAQEFSLEIRSGDITRKVTQQ